MSDNNTPGMPEKKEVTFKKRKEEEKESLGHVHNIIFWNDQQVRCKDKRKKEKNNPIQVSKLALYFFS